MCCVLFNCFHNFENISSENDNVKLTAWTCSWTIPPDANDAWAALPGTIAWEHSDWTRSPSRENTAIGHPGQTPGSGAWEPGAVAIIVTAFDFHILRKVDKCSRSMICEGNNRTGHNTPSNLPSYSCTCKSRNRKTIKQDTTRWTILCLFFTRAIALMRGDCSSKKRAIVWLLCFGETGKQSNKTQCIEQHFVFFY